MDLRKKLINMALKARSASRLAVGFSTDLKNKVIVEMARALKRNKNSILKANQKDIRRAVKDKLSLAFIERLSLSDNRINQMCDSLYEIAKLPDYVGRIIKSWKRPNGLKLEKVRVPIGVIAIIYESRPNVTSDCAGLCFKSSNSVILRGGSEALNSNLSIYHALTSAIRKFRLPQGLINMIANSNRRSIDTLLGLNGYIDLVMPRGGEELINKVSGSSLIPVIKHYKGICHVFVDASADIDMARKICFNAKVQRPGVCNAMESMLVHKNIAARFLPKMLKEFHIAGVEIRGCPVTRKFFHEAKKATDKDYRTEYLSLILSVKVVNDLDSAIEHINTFGSHHSDSIVTRNQGNARKFLNQVDSACVYVNASTRFTDGYQFGMGAEIGISTDKLHARGPMALEELTTYKYRVSGNGQIRTG